MGFSLTIWKKSNNLLTPVLCQDHINWPSHGLGLCGLPMRQDRDQCISHLTCHTYDKNVEHAKMIYIPVKININITNPKGVSDQIDKSESQTLTVPLGSTIRHTFQVRLNHLTHCWYKIIDYCCLWSHCQISVIESTILQTYSHCKIREIVLV